MTQRRAPHGARLDFLDVGDGARIRHAYWSVENPKGSVLLLPGFSEFIEKYIEVADDLTARGYAVHCVDWRSQGLSSRSLEDTHKVHIESFDQYLSDLHRLIQVLIRGDTPKPVFIVAHSMGGHIALRYLHDHPHAVSGAILSAPMVEINFTPAMKVVARLLTRLMPLIGMSDSYVVGSRQYGPARQRFEGNRLTSDEYRFAAAHAEITANPELAIGGPTYGWLSAAMRSCQILNGAGFPEAIKTPIWIAGAGIDGVVMTAAQERFAARAPSVSFHPIDGSRHEILMERDEIRTKFYDLFDDFTASLGGDSGASQ